MAGYGSYYEKLKKGLTSAATVAAGAVSRAAELAVDVATDLTSFKALKDYRLAGHVASAGPGGAWKIFAAVNKKPGALFPEASVWLLDKKALQDQASRAGRARGFDAFFEQQRRAVNQLNRIKHPGVLKVIEPLEETGGQMVFVSEPVFGSLANALTQFAQVPTAPEDRAGVVLSPLELKYGLSHLGNTLHFLHHEAKLAHANLNPGSVIISRDGGWKLAGFDFVTAISEFGSPGGRLTFEYASAQPAPWEEFCVPPLGSTAPELVAAASLASGSEGAASGAADCFSLALLAVQLVAGRALLPVGSSTGEYRSRLSSLASADLSGLPGPLQPLVRAMLSVQPSARPNAAAFAGCQWFAEDMLLRCLTFLDNILQRDSSQKVSFLKDLATFWQQFDDRLLQHRILPPIVAEMRSEMVALAALPVVLAIMGRMKPQGFAASGILPVLAPIFAAADGEVLLALVRNLGVFHALMPPEAHASVLVPLMLRAFDSSNTRAQEETLKALQRLAPELPYGLLRSSLMPRVVGLVLRTTSLLVRTQGLALLAQAVHRLDKEAAGSMLDVCGQIVAVDHSAGTAMAVLRLGEAIGGHYGAELTAGRVLPLLCPLLLSPGLSAPQFGQFTQAIRQLLGQVEQKRGPQLAAAADAASTAAAAHAAAALPAPGSLASGCGSPSGGSAAAGLGPNERLAGALFGSAGASGQGSSPLRAGGPPAAAWDAQPASSGLGAASAAAATPAGSSSWSAGAWAGPGSSGATFGQPQPQAAVAARPAGVSAAAPAPDIFSSSQGGSGPGDLLAGLGLPGPGRGSSGVRPSFAGSSSTDAVGGPFSSLGLGPSSRPAGMARQQQQQQQRGAGQPMAAALRPPPASSRPIYLLGGPGDPFASLAAPPAAAAAGAPKPAGGAAFDPFASLANGSSSQGGSLI